MSTFPDFNCFLQNMQSLCETYLRDRNKSVSFWKLTLKITSKLVIKMKRIFEKYCFTDMCYL